VTPTPPIDQSIGWPAPMFFDGEPSAGPNVALSYVLVLDATLTADDLRAAVDTLKAVSPRLTQRIGLDASGRQQWVPTDVEGRLEVVELPFGSDTADVLEHCSKLQKRAFLLDRQLWQVAYYPGLSGGRSALLVRLHHAVGNGVETLAMLTSAFGVEAEGTRWVEVPQDDSGSRPSCVPAPGEREGAGEPRLNSGLQRVGVLDLGTRRAWDAGAARRGATLDVLSVSLLASATLRYWEFTGVGREAVVITLPTTSEWLAQNSNGALNVHVANLRLTADWVGPDRLGQLSALLAFELVASEQRALEAWQTGATPCGLATSELLVSSFVTVPAMAVQGRRVVDYGGFAPVTGTHVVASPIDYDGTVRMCLNLDTALVSPQVFDACAREAAASLLDDLESTEGANPHH
jgi:hypothetical protein